MLLIRGVPTMGRKMTRSTTMQKSAMTAMDSSIAAQKGMCNDAVQKSAVKAPSM